MTAFQVGQKVVCIKKTAWKVLRGPEHNLSRPKYGEICTVAELVVWWGESHLKLEEYYPKESRAFTPENFRPIHTTSIKVFEDMLAKPPVKQKVSAP